MTSGSSWICKISSGVVWRWVLLLVGAAILVSAGVYWWLNRSDDLAGRASRAIAAADEHGLAMVFTGHRQFRH